MTTIQKIGRVMIPSADQNTAISWYRDKLGFDVTVDIPFGQGDRWVELALPGDSTAIALAPPIGFETTDARALHDDLKGKGVDVDEELMGGDGTVPLLFGFRDAEGNNLMVAQV
jgi:catechol 2,3-dioxygenase-like lactoylglutathione lyase family enzyme